MSARIRNRQLHVEGASGLPPRAGRRRTHTPHMPQQPARAFARPHRARRVALPAMHACMRARARACSLDAALSTASRSVGPKGVLALQECWPYRSVGPPGVLALQECWPYRSVGFPAASARPRAPRRAGHASPRARRAAPAFPSRQQASNEEQFSRAAAPQRRVATAKQPITGHNRP